MITFDPLVTLLTILLFGGLPFAMLSYVFFKKHGLNLLEHAMIGIFAGTIVPSIIPMVLEPFGVLFSPALAYGTYAIMWVAAIAALLVTKSIPTEIKLPTNITKEHVVCGLLLIVLVITYITRIQSYSPVFEELDPYFYAYIPNQIITEGHNPMIDSTAWVPEEQTGHRTMPIFGYMGALWYSITNTQEYSNYLVSLTLNIYPPLAAVLMAFFIYFAVSAYYKKEYGIVAATIASFLPIVMIKFSAGEIEIQPLAFMALAAFFASILWIIKTKDKTFALLSAVAFLALSLGTSSANIAINALIIFIPVYGMLLYLKNEDMKEYLISMGSVLIGMVFIEVLLKGLYFGYLSIPKKILLPALELGVCTIWYYIQKKNFDAELRYMALAGIFIAAAGLLAFTPLGGIFTEFFRGGLEVATYTTSLQRTIAEQGTAGSVFQDTLGFIAITPSELKAVPVIGSILEPLTNILFFIPTLIVNVLFKMIFLVLNNVLHVSVEYGDKAPSLFMFMIFSVIALSAYGLYKNIKYEIYPVLFFIALLFPLLLIGMLKAKYTIYAGVFLAMGIGMALGEGEKLVSRFAKSENAKKYVTYSFVIIACILALGQFLEQSGGLSGIGLLKGSFATRYQDNPLALQEHFKALCAKTRLVNQEDPNICGAAADPVGFASKGIENQYGQTLCVYSILQDVGVTPTPDEYMAMNYRCNRMKDYWIETMEWIKNNPDKSLTMYSWWDYGHWTNWFGQKNTVLRNDHASTEMIGRVAHSYTMGTQNDLISAMKHYNSKYILIDGAGDGIVINKFGALNYLGCAWANQTTLQNQPGYSQCEQENRWEEVYVPKDQQYYKPCTISESQNIVGITAMSSHYAGGYCVGPYRFPDGRQDNVAYYLDQKEETGDLRVNRAFLKPVRYDSINQNGQQFEVVVIMMLYTQETVWNKDGVLTSGFEDKKGRYYDSVLYRGYLLGDMPGFENVFTSKNGEVKIYKLVG